MTAAHPDLALDPYALAERLVAGRELPPDALGRALGCILVPEAARPDAPVRVWRLARALPQVASLELREAQRGRVILAVFPGTPPTGPQLAARLGPPETLRPPPPEAPHLPTWTVWRRDWGRLSLGRDSGDPALVHVVVDTVPPRDAPGA